MHLRVLEIQRAQVWYAHTVLPGTRWERERDNQLQTAHIILFLISADFIDTFISSREQYERTVVPVMERHERGEVRVIPIILRPVYWQETLFAKLQPLPEGGKPVDAWKLQDEAFLSVVHGIKRVIDEEQPRLFAQQEENSEVSLSTIEEGTPVGAEAVVQLEHIIQGFKILRGHIASTVMLKRPQGFSVESCERQYRKLYGDTLVFLTIHLPQVLRESEDGFVETVHRKATAELRQRSNFEVWLYRKVFTSLAEIEQLKVFTSLVEFEQLAAQIDACAAILELYKRKHFS